MMHIMKMEILLPTYKMTKCFVKMSKTHRNIADQDIEKAWKEPCVIVMVTILMMFDEYHQRDIFIYRISNRRTESSSWDAVQSNLKLYRIKQESIVIRSSTYALNPEEMRLL